MSVRTRALLERYFAAFNAGDIPGMLACLAPDIRHDVNEGSARLGKVAFEAFCKHMADCYAEQLVDLIVFASDDGRRGAAEFLVKGRYLKTDAGLPPAHGQPYELPAGSFFTIEDGLITRVTTYYNLKRWIELVSV